MAIVNGYCTLAGLKTRLSIADTNDDAMLEAIVESVSRAIDDWCGRRFYAATQTRYFTALRSDRLLVDDLLSVTTIRTDEDGDGTFERTWTATDYFLAPYNAQLESVPQPYTKIEAAWRGSYRFPRGVRRGVEVAGSWGFASTTPDAVEQACLFQAAVEFRATPSPLGLSGGGELGQEIRVTGMSYFAKRLLEPYRRIVVA